MEQQPLQPQTTVVVGGPQPAPQQQYIMLQPGDFNTSLFDCCAEPGGWGLCCMTFCCGCVTAGRVNDAVGGPGGFFGGCCGMFVPLLNLFCIWNMAMETLKKIGIKGDAIMVFFKTWCCAPCTLCQVRRQQISVNMQKGVPMAMMKVGAPTYGVAQQQVVQVQHQPNQMV